MGSWNFCQGPRYVCAVFPRLKKRLSEVLQSCFHDSIISSLPDPEHWPEDENWINVLLNGLETHTQLQLSGKLTETSHSGSTLTEVYLHLKWNAGIQVKAIWAEGCGPRVPDFKLQMKRWRKDELEFLKLTFYMATKSIQILFLSNRYAYLFYLDFCTHISYFKVTRESPIFNFL